MKILYLTFSVPVNMKYGGGIRSEAIFTALCSQHEVVLALIPFEAVNPVEYCTKFGPLLPVQEMFVLTPQAGFVNIQRQAASLEGLIELVKPDLVWAFEKWVLRKTGFPKSVPTVLDLVDVQWYKHWRTLKYQQGREKLITALKMLKSVVEDNLLAAQAWRVIISNAQEKKYLLAQNKAVHIPNGFTFPNEFYVRANTDSRLLFFGLLNYYPNLNGIEWFCNHVWPIILDHSPQASLDIIGDFSTVVGGLAGLRKIRGIQLHGFVDEIDPWIEKSAALVVPLQIAGGTRIKIIEAWAKGLPVVSTAVGCEGLDAQNGETLLIADQPGDFARACLSLMNDPVMNQSIARLAYERSKPVFDWGIVLNRIPRLLADIRS